MSKKHTPTRFQAVRGATGWIITREAGERIAVVTNKGDAELLASAPTLAAENARLRAEREEMVRVLAQCVDGLSEMVDADEMDAEDRHLAAFKAAESARFNARSLLARIRGEGGEG